MDQLERRQVRFSGRVQGVGFRATARALALSHDLTGWVRNEPDGTVLLEAQGRTQNLDGFLDELRAAMRDDMKHATSLHIPTHDGDLAFEVRR
jgi:acylphosphatase